MFNIHICDTGQTLTTKKRSIDLRPLSMSESRDDEAFSLAGPQADDVCRDYSFDSGYCSSTPNKLPGHVTYRLSAPLLSTVKEEPVDSPVRDPFISEAMKHELFSPLTSRRVAIEHNAEATCPKLEDWDSCIDETFEEDLFNLVSEDFSSPLSVNKLRGRHNTWHTPSSSSQLANTTRLKRKRLFSPEDRSRRPSQTFVRLSPIKLAEADSVALQENFTCSRSKSDRLSMNLAWSLNVARTRFSDVLRDSVAKTRGEYAKRNKNANKNYKTGYLGTVCDNQLIISDSTVKLTSHNTVTRRKQCEDSLLTPVQNTNNKSAKTLLLSQSSIQYCKIRPKPIVWTLQRL